MCGVMKNRNALFVGVVIMLVAISIIGCSAGKPVAHEVGTTPIPTETPFADYVIVASAGSGGSIDPSGQNFAYPGSGLTFTITPYSGFKISDVIVDGISKGAISIYSFEDVQTSHEITASFSQTEPFTLVYFALVATAAVIAIVVVAVLLMKKREKSLPAHLSS